MLSLFHENINILQHEKQLAVLVISSGVPNVFCSGADLKERATMKSEEVSDSFVFQKIVIGWINTGNICC